MIETAISSATGDSARSTTWVNAAIIKEIAMHHDNLRMVLAPHIFSDRYDSWTPVVAWYALLKSFRAF